MVELSLEDRAKLLEVLLGIEELASTEGRRVALVNAGLGHLAPHIRLDGTAYTAVSQMVGYLASYGRTERGEEALGLLLNALKPLTGRERQLILADLMTRHAMMTPVAYAPPVGEWRGRSTPGQVQEKIIVADTLRPIAFLAHALEVARPVALIEVAHGGQRWSGSGFLVAPDLMLTCAHVLPDPDLLRGTLVRFNYEDDRFGNALRPVDHRPRPGGLHHADERLDYAVFELPGEPGAEHGWLPWTDPRTRAGERVNIIQHPGGRPKQIALQSNFVEYVGGDVVQYVTATLPGSSGSPVFNDSWEVCAVHRAGGTLTEPTTGDHHFRNEGVLLSSIIDDLPEPVRTRLVQRPAGK